MPWSDLDVCAVQNDERACQLFQQAAAQGHADAQAYLGFFHANGLGGLPRCVQAATEWSRKAAVQGSQFALKALKDM